RGQNAVIQIVVVAGLVQKVAGTRQQQARPEEWVQRGDRLVGYQLVGGGFRRSSVQPVRCNVKNSRTYYPFQRLLGGCSVYEFLGGPSLFPQQEIQLLHFITRSRQGRYRIPPGRGQVEFGIAKHVRRVRALAF